MPTQFVNFTLPGYIADWALAGAPTPISGRFNKPPGLNDAGAAAILNAINAELKSATTKAPCTPPASFSPRRLKFSFATGGSLSVPFPQKDSAVALATTIKNGLTTNLGEVVCVELIGEKWGRVDEELRPPDTIVAPGVDMRVTSGTKNPIFTAAYSYLSDTGRTSVQSVKQNTNSADSPAGPFQPYSEAIISALGDLLPKGCGGTGNVKARHYTVTVLTESTANPTRQLIVPVAGATSAAIRAAGEALAVVTQTLCLSYEGESDARLSRLIP